MRIIFHENSHVPTGFVQVLQHYGHKTYVWKREVPPFDIFDIYQPDIVVVAENDISSSLNKCIEETNNEVIIFSNDCFYFPAFPNIEFPCSLAPLGVKLDIVYFGEYTPLLFDLCLPDSDRNLKIFNSSGLKVPQEIGWVSLEEIGGLIDKNVTLIDIEGSSDPEFTWIGLGRGARIVTNNPRIPSPIRFTSNDELKFAIASEQENSYSVGKIDTYKDRVVSFFKKMKLQEEADIIEDK